MPHESHLEVLCINAIRCLALDAVEAAGAGHAGTPLGAAAMAFALWDRHLKHDPGDPSWMDRDRFVLSAGHASLLLYALLYLTGYDLPLEELKRFRQEGSRTPGHPELSITPGVEMTSGPLGQGFAHAVGMALAERMLAARYNREGHRVIDHYTYALVSDGDLQEGVSAEAASLAGTLGLSKLIVLYDDNEMQIEGPTDLAFTEDVAARFRSYGWQVLGPVDGLEVEAVSEAIHRARGEASSPSMIIAATRIGFGSPVEATARAHHGPLGEDAVRQTKLAFHWPVEPAFYVPPEALAYARISRERGRQARQEWHARWEAYGRLWPDEAGALERQVRGQLPEGWDRVLDAPLQSHDGAVAPRVVGGKLLNALAECIPALVGGSADLAPSTMTHLANGGDVSRGRFEGRNIHFGVREHAMAALAGGMALHGGFIPCVSTYLAFSDYLRPSLRLAAMMGLRVVYVFTHDSIAVGMDGPTHQAVEQLMSLRAVPNLTVIRPADAAETAEAWRAALSNASGPTALILARQDLPQLRGEAVASARGLRQGAYVLWEPEGGGTDLILIGSGSETHLALQVGRQLGDEGLRARVVSMPCWELFDSQPVEYRENVLPSRVRNRISIEAGVTRGWERYVGLDGETLGVNTYGASAPASCLFQQFGLSPAQVLDRVRRTAVGAPGD